MDPFGRLASKAVGSTNTTYSYRGLSEQGIAEAERSEMRAAEESKQAQANAEREAEAQPVVVMDDPFCRHAEACMASGCDRNGTSRAPLRHSDSSR